MSTQDIMNKIELQALLNMQASEDEAMSDPKRNPKADPNRKKPDFDTREKPIKAEDPSIECKRGMDTYIQQQLKKGPCGAQKNYVNWQPGASPFAPVKIPDIQANINQEAIPVYGVASGAAPKSASPPNPNCKNTMEAVDARTGAGGGKSQTSGGADDGGCKDKRREGFKFKLKPQGVLEA